MPESILHWGLGLITAIQRLHGPFLDGFFRAISALGEEPFYLLVLPLVLWCLDFGLGARLGVVFLLSSYLNVGLKDIFRQPRPFDLDPAVKLAPVTGYGLPSGHAQSSIVGWGFLAMQARRRAVWIIVGALILLIGFSRIYLGLHFPTDVLGGWIIGLLVLWVFLGLEPAATRHLAHLGLAGRIGLAILLPAALFLLHPTADTATALGTLAGFGAGLALEQRSSALRSAGHGRKGRRASSSAPRWSSCSFWV